MSNITFANVSPLIAEKRVVGRTLMVSFRCPVTGQTVPASFNAPMGSQAGQRVKQVAGRTMGYEVRRAMTGVLRSVFGYSPLGRIATSLADEALRQTTHSAMRSAGGSTGLSAAEEKDAAVEAFKSVAAQFVWDAKGARWVGIAAMQELMSPFQRRLTQAPIQHPYDRQVLARMLVEIAASDGHLAEEEQEFFTEFIDPSLGSVESLTQRPPLTAAELAQTSRGASRETMLALAWVLTLADEAYQQAEADKIAHFAQGLAISQAAHAQLLKDAQAFLLEQSLERMIGWGGHDDHARREFMGLAQRLGVAPA
ncbi:MAG: hypothetical protein JXX28_03765, partial [Deltaproteobacteria bacterium]|nr:hypothetical protein [Deltaproteobacteria bacterium]